MLVLLMAAVTGAMATEYVSQVLLIGSGESVYTTKQQYLDQGWKDTNYNLNKGCGSSATNIFLLYKTSTNKAEAITGFYIQCGSSKRSNEQSYGGHTYHPVNGAYDDNFVNNQCNLNNNAGGNKIYLFFTRDAFDDGRAVTEIWFDNAKSGGVGSNGNDSSPCDLNSGANGSFIYMHAYYGERPNSVEYEERTWDTTNKKVITTTKTCDSFTRLTSNNNKDKHEVLTDGWYVLDDDIDYKEYLDIDGDVKMILMNGKTMNAHNGIRIKTDKKLTIYGQDGNTGKIKADGSIGGKGDIYAGELIIHGGTIDCKSASHNNAAIGSGNGDNNKNAGYKAITIYDGNVTATGGGGGAGIGSGQECNDDKQGPITIYGGTVNATGGNGGAGIGGGEESGNGPIYIYGGSVTATGGAASAGIGVGEDSHLCNDIYILGGTVNATGGADGDGIGCTDSWDGTQPKQNKDLYVENATVYLYGKEDKYSSNKNCGLSVNVRDLHITNAMVYMEVDHGKVAQINGNIYLADNLCVNTNNGAWLSNVNDRENDIIKTELHARVGVCGQHLSDISLTDKGDGTHHMNCKYCKGVDEPHSYTYNEEAGVYKCSCGVTKNFTTQAIWCAGNHTLYFVNAQEDYQAGGEYDGQTITSVTSGNNVTNTSTTLRPSWGLTTRADLQHVVFDESFAMVTPQSLYSWFADCWGLTTIEGIEHLNTSACTTMESLFDNCSGLTSIDVNGFDMSNVSTTKRMFAYCENLKTIYCDNTWSGIETSNNMFSGCTSLKGSMATVSYNNDNANDITFANPSTGYFTNTGAVFAQALWCNGNKTLYFVHPEAPVKVGEAYNGQTVTSVWSGGHVLATGDTEPGWSDVKTAATTVVFDASFAAAKPTSLVSWFSGFTSLTTADLNGLDVSEAESAASMFSGCTSLTTLYCESTWTIANTEGMFTGCTSLKGAVSYDAAKDNGIMANPTSGYFAKQWTVELLNDGINVSNLTPYTNETVTISGTGDSGSGIAAVTVTGQRTDVNITVTDNGNGTWTFTMPAEDVTVKEELNIALHDNADNSEVLRQNKGKTVNVSINDRTLYKDGSWNTLCLPFDVALDGSPLEGATVMELDIEGEYSGHQTGFDATNGTLYLYFKEVDMMRACKPYLIKWTTTDSPITSPTFYNSYIDSSSPEVVMSTDSKVSFKGIYDPETLPAGDKSNLYLGIDNQGKSTLYWPSSDRTVNAFRAYFHVDGTVSAIQMYFGEDENTTAINEYESHKSHELSGAWYTLDGRRIANGQKPTAKGLYIVNGRKVVIK